MTKVVQEISKLLKQTFPTNLSPLDLSKKVDEWIGLIPQRDIAPYGSQRGRNETRIAATLFTTWTLSIYRVAGAPGTNCSECFDSSGFLGLFTRLIILYDSRGPERTTFKVHLHRRQADCSHESSAASS